MMETRQLPRSVLRITRVERDSTGATVARIVYEKPQRRKKGSPAARPFERVVRRMVAAVGAGADRYAAAHERSNQKTGDGWISDLPSNLTKAARSGTKKLKITRPIFP